MIGPERRSPRYHETSLALGSVEESSAAVSKPRCVWLRARLVTFTQWDKGTLSGWQGCDMTAQRRQLSARN